MRRTALIAVAVVIVAGIVYYRFAPTPPTPPDRTAELTQLVADQQEQSARALAAYAPNFAGRLDDLSVDASAILRQLPGDVRVEIKRGVKKPTCRIIHLRDWHLVPKEQYAVEVGADLDRLHRELVLEVEAVQIEQMALLRCLIRHHGLKAAYSEGLAPESMPNFRKHVSVLRNMEAKEIRDLRRQLREVRELGARDLEGEILSMLDAHRERMAEIGAAGRLMVAGELEVLPLEDVSKLAGANPTSTGRLQFDPSKIAEREHAQIKTVLAGGGGLIVLGASHDLTDGVAMLDVRCEYITVTTKRVAEFAKIETTQHE